MARQILPIAGQIVGGMIGGPVGAAIGGAIGSAVGAYVDPIRHQGPKLGEARAQTAQEGVYRPLVFGTGCVSGNVIHRSPRKVVRHRERVGKGGRDTVDSDRGYRTFAIRIAEAHTPEGYQLLRIWENETLVYDVRPGSEIPQESQEYAEKFRFYPGTQDQLPDPDLEAYMGVGNVNSYRGSCYIVFGNFDLTDYGDMVPQYRFEIQSLGGSSGPIDSMTFYRTATKLYGRSTADGESWSGWNQMSGNADPTNALATSNRYIIYGSSSQIYWTDDGQTLNLSGGGSSNTARIGGVSDNGTIIIGQALSEMRRSQNNGDSFHNIPGSPRSLAVVPVGNRWISYDNAPSDRKFRVSVDDGDSWAEAAETASPILPNSAWSNGEVAAFAGPTPSGGQPQPAVYFTATGGSYAAENLPFPPQSSATAVPAIAFGNGVWVAASAEGQIAYRDNDGWHLAIYALPVPPVGITFNGRRFIIVGGSPPIGRRVYVSSENGKDWSVDVDEQSGFNLQGDIASLHILASPTMRLSQIISWCHQRVGQGPAVYDVSELDDEVDGVVFADGYTARDAIMSLLPIYNADASEHDRGSGYRINYIKRGAPVVRTLTIDDLVDEPEGTVREDPMERPRVLHMAFESPVTGYTAGKASIQRLSPDVKLVNEVSTYVPVTFKDVNEAWQRADVQMRVAWTEVHGERTFSISDGQLDIVPTDVLALSLRGQVQRLRVLKVEYADGVLKLETVADRQSNYTSHVTGIPLPAPEKPPPSLMGPAAIAILDIPAISDQHDRLGYYVAVCGTTEAYAGAVIQRQQNGEWADVVRLGRSQRAIMGVLENTVSAASEHYTDTTNTVSVALYMEDELESLSDAQWLSEGGAFALETESGWEIMQYRDAYQDSAGVWHLTHLARGRLNTVPAEHLPGSRFVLLDGVRFIDATVGMIGQTLTLRAAAVGRSPETAVPETITYQGYSQREFPVAHLVADLDGDDLSLQAIPRDRFGTEVHPVRSINHDGFRWSATDGSSTVSLDTDHATATLDVSGLSTPITATVAQLNRFTGAGPTVSELIE